MFNGFVKCSVFSIALVFMVACGGGGGNSQNDGNGTTIDATSPTFTSFATVTVSENQTDAIRQQMQVHLLLTL